MRPRHDRRPLWADCDRREFLERCVAAAGAATMASGFAGGSGAGLDRFTKLFAGPHFSPMQTARIPSSGETIARMGLGTWQTFDVGADATKRAALAETLKTFIDGGGGGAMIDTSPMYGTSEEVLGDLLANAGLREKAWLATKVWTEGEEAGERQMLKSLSLLRTGKVQLMQVHNLVDWRAHLRTMRAWKDTGRVKYIGVSHYERDAHETVERVLEREKLDFVQLNLSLDEPEASERMLSFCEEKGIAFIANRPFGGGKSFTKAQGKPLPRWCEDYGITSWAQFMLKWVLSHPAVTVTIPGTGNPAHMADNMSAATGKIPDVKGRALLAAHWDSL
jgi:diketogulonate reductase-like aldo/keto reductase